MAGRPLRGRGRPGSGYTIWIEDREVIELAILKHATLVLGRSPMQVVPSVESGRYSPGPGMINLLEEHFYQVLRRLVVFCSQNWPGNRAIDSQFLSIVFINDLERCGPNLARY